MKMKNGAKKLFAMMMMVVLLIASVTVANASTNVTVGGDTTNKQLAYAPNKTVKSISVKPNKVEYIDGDSIDAKDLVVTATYTNNKKEIVSGYTISPTGPLKTIDGKRTFIVVYVTFENIKAKYKITVNPLVVTSVFATLNKVEYTEDDIIVEKDLVVTAKYSNDKQEIVSGYTIDPAGPLKTTSKAVSVTYQGITSNRYSITVNPKLIGITASGATNVYTDGAMFDPSKLVVKAQYTNNEVTITSGYTITPERALTMSDKFVTINFNGKTVNYPITVNAKLLGITISKAKLEYVEGEKFDTDNLIISANYSDGVPKEIKNNKEIKINPSGALKTSDKVVTISWGGMSVSSPIIVKAIPKLTAITAVNARTAYTEGESFDPTGMILIAKYSDNSEKEITKGWTINPSGQLIVGNKYVEISYQGVKTQYPIKVNEKNRLIGITVTNAKTVYTEGEAFDTSNLQVKTNYSNGTEEVVTDYSVTPNGPLTSANKTVRVSYGGYSKDIAITVNAAKLTLTVINGSGSGTYGMNAKVLISPTLKKGEYFTGWKLENGKILTKMDVYYFLLTRSMTIEAVVSDKKPTTTPVVALDESYKITKNNGTWKATILGTFTNTTYWNFFSRTGFVTVNEKDYTGGEITLNSKDAVDVDATYSMNAAGQVYRAIHTQNPGRFYVRAYTTYLDGYSGFKTIYSDNTVLVDIK